MPLMSKMSDRQAAIDALNANLSDTTLTLARRSAMRVGLAILNAPDDVASRRVCTVAGRMHEFDKKMREQ